MNYVADEMRAILEGEEVVEHIGVKYRSGRYPWGSGDDPYQNSRTFLSRREQLLKEGFTYTDENGKKWTGDNAIAKSLGLSSGEYRREVSIAKDEKKLHMQNKIQSLRDDGLGDTEIGRRLGINESTVRSMMNAETIRNTRQARETAAFIKKQIDERGMIDVGKGVERELQISKEKLDTALHILQKEGYELYSGGMDQVTMPGQRTTQKVICPPGTPHSDIYKLDQVHSLKEYTSRDNGETYEKKFHYPASLDSKRLQICYKEDGGIDRDGIVELRRGVKDLSLGESRYAQVRILVDGTHYIKGMAVYSDDLPDGIDVRFNTNKERSVPMKEVLKKIKSDPDNPFGSLIKDADQGGQYWYDDKTTGEKKLGLINKRADEGDWTEWKDTLPSQFLGKQSQSMAKKQLNLAKADKLAEYDAICSLENPTLKKHFLKKFADECDTAAVDLKAAALPGQKYHVIIPINTLKDNEIYAPQYESGTKLALVRYPHGGTFEIPIVTVNNKHAPARKLLGTDIVDGVGINAKVAERLSGADFDGDTVMCIPTHDAAGKVKITSRNNLKGLEGFDPKTKYGRDEKTVDPDGTEHYYRNGREYKIMGNTNIQMGVISNLITDMTLAGAPDNELAAAVRHSMVVIDAEKHKLDYRQSAIDNNINYLHKKYQSYTDESGKVHNKGAGTILSRSKGPKDIEKRKGQPNINEKGKPWYDPDKPEGSLIYKNDPDAVEPIWTYSKKTGKRTMTTADGRKVSYDPTNDEERELYKPVKKKDPDTGEVTYTNKSGTIKYATRYKTQESTRMAETDDAYTLVSKDRHPMELIYADYANSMKSLANKARLEYLHTGKIAVSDSAKKVYAEEVKSLNKKINDAELNYTREREAQRRANVERESKKQAYLEETGEKMKAKDVKKTAQQSLTKYRQEVGTISRKERNIEITDREWEAIQAGAISESKLWKILNNTDTDNLRQRAMPRATTTLSSAQISRVKALAASNYTLEQIAKKMGKSPSTISKYLKGAN